MIKSKIAQERKVFHRSWPKADRAENLKGKRFGKLTVQGDPRRYTLAKQKRTHWHCLCDCGGESFVVASSLKRGLTTSCGCEMRDVLLTHGYCRNHPATYSVWRAMKERCLNPNSTGYGYYGGAGVVICDAWMDFENFLSDMGERPEGLTIDRYHPDWQVGNKPLPYSPETCRWATRIEQQNNRCNNVYIEYEGKKLTSAQWSRITGISADAIYMRVMRGWSVSAALKTPIRAQ